MYIHPNRDSFILIHYSFIQIRDSFIQICDSFILN